ncbi:MAG: SDR family oxidoreductase [Ruminococcaceae bacterium]|nr:SDR family oxidoreductase [Oscillospiraceae bacterium]
MKTVVITGAAGGMGVALCHRLAKAGINLALCSHSAERLEALAKDLTATYGIKVTYAAFEIYEEAAVKAFFDSAAAELGNFDALVNLAGLSIPTKMETVTEEDFDRMIDVNVKGTLFASKHYALHAYEEGGLIINVGSMAARRANGNAPLYCTAKSALNMMASAMQIQLAQRNIRVTTLNPGGADTPFWGTRQVDRSKFLSADDVVDVIEFTLNHPRMVIHSVDFESAATVPATK